MNIRYQVFLSSTYEDLKEERLEVMKALLELDCIPCGMEYFPASNEDQWSYITGLIDESDYYIVVIAGKYGSTDESGTSYTQKEYEYAIEKGIPTIAFLHGEPGSIQNDRCEQDANRRVQLEQFRQLCRNRLCKTWNNSHELGAVVSRSLTQLIKRTPRSGWVRADSIASEDATREIISLRHTIEELQKELEKNRLQPPLGTDQLAQGLDQIVIEGSVLLTNEKIDFRNPKRQRRMPCSIVVSWDKLFGTIAPNMIAPVTDAQLRNDIGKLMKEINLDDIRCSAPDFTIGIPTIADSQFKTIKVQFSALGLIEPILVKRESEKRKTDIIMWRLTPLGNKKLVQVKAIKR